MSLTPVWAGVGRWSYYEDNNLVGTGTLKGDEIGVIIVNPEHWRKGHGQAILEHLVSVGGRTAFAITPEGLRTARKLVHHERVEEDGSRFEFAPDQAAARVIMAEVPDMIPMTSNERPPWFSLCREAMFMQSEVGGMEPDIDWRSGPANSRESTILAAWAHDAPDQECAWCMLDWCLGVWEAADEWNLPTELVTSMGLVQ